MTIVSESAVWAALRVDLEPYGSPPVAELAEPADRNYILSLIYSAETRLAAYIGQSLGDLMEENEFCLPDPLIAAVCLDVSCSYYNRLDPQLPDSYFSLIAPWRAWGFGATD